MGRKLVADEVAAVERLCATLEGHPLRVLQAAARAREERRPIVAIARTAQPPPLALSEPERTVLTALGVICVPMDHVGPAAITTMPNVDTVLDQLEQRRIVAADNGRYRLAIEPLHADEQTTLVTTRALEHYGELAESSSDDPARVRTEYEPIVRTIRQAITLGWTRDALRLARLVETPLILGARWGAWRHRWRSPPWASSLWVAISRPMHASAVKARCSPAATAPYAFRSRRARQAITWPLSLSCITPPTVRAGSRCAARRAPSET